MTNMLKSSMDVIISLIFLIILDTRLELKKLNKIRDDRVS